jgi:hypothetical protein
MSNREKRLYLLLIIPILIFAIGVYFYVNAPRTQAVPQSQDTQLNLGKRTKTESCEAKNSLPDPKCTPGDVFTDVTAKEICVSGYSGNARNVSDSLKENVYKQYGITHRDIGEYQVDHLISLELGGSNDISNLWPQAATPLPGYREKITNDNFLHEQVCSGKMTLITAQQINATDWVSYYNKTQPRNLLEQIYIQFLGLWEK